VQLGMPIVHLPDVVFNALLRDASEVKQKVVTPDTARHFLRECKTLVSLGKSYKLVLLEYCLEDLIDAEAVTHAYEMPLFPLAKGDFGLLSGATKGIFYFVFGELECMPKLTIRTRGNPSKSGLHVGSSELFAWPMQIHGGLVTDFPSWPVLL
jgi:sacsin